MNKGLTKTQELQVHAITEADKVVSTLLNSGETEQALVFIHCMTTVLSQLWDLILLEQKDGRTIH